jgi:hypothetical protein
MEKTSPHILTKDKSLANLYIGLLLIPHDEMEDDPPDNHRDKPNPSAPPTDLPPPSRLRLNLIRHRFATSTDQTTLQLFKSFMTVVRKADPKLTIFPVDSMKQGFTSPVSQKQINKLNQNQL